FAAGIFTFLASIFCSSNSGAVSFRTVLKARKSAKAAIKITRSKTTEVMTNSAIPESSTLIILFIVLVFSFMNRFVLIGVFHWHFAHIINERLFHFDQYNSDDYEKDHKHD